MLARPTAPDRGFDVMRVSEWQYYRAGWFGAGGRVRVVCFTWFGSIRVGLRFAIMG